MPLWRKQPEARRSPRNEAFRSRDLVRELRGPLAPWGTREGFRRLGERGWIREHTDGHLMIAVQARRRGWDKRAGSQFVVEFEVSGTPTLETGAHRDRIWRLLSTDQRLEAIQIINAVACTLPPPDRAFVEQLPRDAQAWYLRQWKPELTADSSDVWFNYYDEDDARTWAEFLVRTIGPVLERFLNEPPTFFGIRGDKPAAGSKRIAVNTRDPH